MKKSVLLFTAILVLTISGSSEAVSTSLWGVNPQASGAELINIDPFTGVIYQSYAISGISASDTEIGLAGSSSQLYYANSNSSPGQISVINSATGSVVSSFALENSYQMGEPANTNGLGYWSGPQGSYLYTSGCEVGDVHRYNASDGFGVRLFWSDAMNVQSVAGDAGGRIFVYGTGVCGRTGIFEVDPLSTYASLGWFAASPSDSIIGMASDGTNLYLSDLQGNLYTLNGSGSLINTLNLPYNLYALAGANGTSPIVPVPGAVILAGIGIGLVGWLRKCRTLI